MGTLSRDIGCGLRVLGRSLGFAAVAILILAQVYVPFAQSPWHFMSIVCEE